MIRPVGSSSGVAGLVPKSTGGSALEGGIRRGYASRFIKNHLDNFMDNPKVQALDRFVSEHGNKIETGLEVGSGFAALGAFLQKRKKSKERQQMLLDRLQR
jgi:hypothetical protein